ncbi:MucBP domain-containing protein, partial [Limosilactobacillus sp. pH52_RY]|uniref:mucin-binding protein n=1 Tax=Limosilactobacillus balticus TaxID=2759747 RepID=UPI0015FCA6B2
MLSHNNWEEQIKKYEPKKQRFTIKKLSVGVASVLLGMTFAAGTASADSTTANADSDSGSDSAEQTDHNLTLTSASTSTLKSATAENQNNNASAAVQNPAGDIKAQAANDYEAAVSAAVADASSNVDSAAAQNSASSAQQNSASAVQNSSTASSNVQASTASAVATQSFTVSSSAVNNDLNYASVLTSLVQTANNNSAAAQSAVSSSTTNDEYSTYKTVTDWNGLQNAVLSGAQGVNIKGNITPGFLGTLLGNGLTINGNFTIHGIDGAVLNLGQSKIVNNGQLTLADVTVNGSVTGNGTVNIKGNVTSNVDAFNSTTLTSAELTQQIGSNHPGATVDNWKAANITASNVNVEQGATLNINRSITGDGINEPDGGKINVGINANLNINLKDAQTASRANEESSSIDNANAGVRILDNGTFTSGDSATINIHAGHGRAVVINEPFGGTSAVANNSSLEGWENGRTGDKSAEAAKHKNTMTLGDSTTMNITGRGGIVLGYTATFTTGDHSIIHIDNQGNGEGLLLDANSVVEVSPHSQLIMTSDGKNASGYYGGGNYIGMGQNAKFRVEHDATFRYKLTNAANNEKRPYADNFNIISQASNTHPEVYVGPNATFDGQSDYDDYYGEIFAYSLTSGANTSTVFQIDGAKYVNWEKNSQVIGHSGAGNLYYSMGPGLIDATGQKYYVFKWNNKNLNDNNYTFDDSTSDSIAQSIKNFENSSDKYWTDIEHLATKYSKSGNTAEWPGHVVSGNDITAGSGYNPVDKKTGTPIGNYNSGDGDNGNTTGFDPLNSQRLVLVASIIPTQEDDTKQEVQDYNVKIVYDENLQPGQVKLVQKGVNGLKRTTTTTYYNVDPSTGEKTLDTSKGQNGVSTTTTILNEEQDEIIHIGKQTAIINYLKQDGNNTATPITNNGQAIVGTVTGNPVKIDAQGNVEFNAAGNATANTIDYTTYESDLATAKNNAQGYKYNETNDQWAQAVKEGTNKYNVSGLTKAAIQEAAEKAGLNNAVTIAQEGPVFNVVLKKAIEKGSVKVVYHDDTTNTDIPNTEYNTGSVDAVTNEIIPGGQYTTDWEIPDGQKTTYDQVNTPVVNGYYADQANVPETAVTQNDIEKTVTYKPVGSVVPVDPNGNPIPGVPSTPFPNDPTDPTKTTPGTKPTVPGYHPETGKPGDPVDPVPGNPGEDVKVPYVKDAQDQTVTVKYIDDTTGEGHTDLSSYDKSITAKPGEGLNYSTAGSIAELENKGYKLVSDNFNVTTMPQNGGSYEVHFIHNTTTITPDKPGTPGEPINPNDPDGPKWPNGTDDKSLTKDGSQTVHYVYADGTKAADDNVQNTTFAHTLVFDNVTGKQIEDKGWAPESHTFNNVTSPEIDGYHADKKIVDGATVTIDNPTSETTVTYTKNDQVIRDQREVKASQKVKYVDDQGIELKPTKTQDFTYNYTGDTYDKETGDLVSRGTWNQDSNDFTAEVVPVIDGYVAVSGYTNEGGKYVAGGFTTTHDESDAQRNRVFTVVYKKVGKIVPVDPDHNPIPDAPTPTYTNDPTDPTKVTPNEPVPDVPGYTPETPTVTPGVPTEDTPVIYNPVTPAKDQKALVNYVDADEGNKVITTSGDLSGKAGDKIDYSTATTIQDLENKGYVLVNDGFPAGATYDNDDGTVQTYTVVLRHGTQPVTPTNPGKPGEPINPNDPDGPKYPQGSDQVTKNVTRTIQYVDENGNKVSDSVEQPVNFTAQGVLDKVTGEWTTPLTWSIDQTVSAVKSPVIDGFHLVSVDRDATGNDVKGVTLTHDDNSYTVTVKYAKNGKIVPVDPTGKPIPDVPQPQYPTDPTDPSKVTPDEPVPTIPGYTPEVPTVTPDKPGEDTPVVYTPVDNTQNAQVRYIDLTNDEELANSGNLTGQPGDKINYSTADEIKSLEDKGYVLVNDGFPTDAAFDNDKDHDQVFTVTFRHGTQPVNPNEPGKPGEPINPNDPDGPKYPQGSDQVTKNVTRTIQYVDENGNKVSDPVEQTVNFTAQGVLDKVTGEWTTPLTWSNDQTVSVVKSPLIDGYHLVSVDRDAAGNDVEGVTLTHENDSYTVTVTYAKNGKIIPVDPTGKPIPDVPQPQYPTDPTDPSKVTPDEPVPSIPGYTPEVPTVTPDKPGEDTPVVYHQNVQATVNYVDDVTGQTLKTDTLNGVEGNKSDYSTKSSIASYENQGYKLVSDDFPADGYTFATGEHVFNVHLTHSTSPVNPDHPGAGYSATDLKKTVTRTINYLDGQGNTVANSVSQSFDFIANGTVDNVTHKLVTVENGKITGDGQLTWNATSHDFDAVDSPAVNGMHVANVTPADQKDGDNVAKTTVNNQSGNILVNVYYAPNGTHQDGAKTIPSTQTVTFVDEDGNELHAPAVNDFTFSRTPDITDAEGKTTEGSWNATSHTYGTVNVPVIPGYVAEVTTAGGKTATIDNPNVTDKVVYKKVGKIIPVDPTGKPIPDAPTPNYPNDPTDPTKVTPGEPVPSIPGYTPDTPTVTPEVPTTDTPVVYRQNVQATVTYIDDVTGSTLKTDSLNGLEGKASDYSTKGSIANYESQGYELVSDDFPADGYTFSTTGTHSFTVHLTHGTEPVNPEHPGAGYDKTDLQKEVTRTVHFVNTQNGNQVADPVSETVNFTANGTVDKVTGKLVTIENGKITGPGQLTWTPAQDVKAVESPAINGMHVTYVSRDADGTNVKGVSLTHNDSSYDVYVNYAPNGTTTENGQNIPASQTIKFVDENGNTLRENNVQTSEFTRTPDVIDSVTGKTITEGSWNETSHKFGTINVPVIDGYVAEVTTAGGLTATTDNPNVVTEVVYKKVGKIVPVDPTGKPIPDVPTPSYPNDPTDPTKVTPDEPVPTIPGYIPETPTVTPEVPTKDTPVVYNPVDNTQNAQVRYIDLTNDEELANSGNLTGQPGDKINYSTTDTIKSLTDKGYVLVNDGFPADAAFDNDKGHDQVFTVTFRHGTQPVNPNEPGKPGEPINPNDPDGPKYPQGSDQVTKNVTRTVQYVDADGNKISEPVEQTVNFTAQGVLDKVTGQWTTPLTWSSSQFVTGVKTPVVEGYHVVNVDRDGDGVNVKGVTLTHENDNYTVTVSYAKNGKIVPVDPTGKPIPDVPQPQYPTDPTDPSTVTPNEPVPTIPGFVPEVPTVTPTDPGKDTPVHYTPVINDQTAVVNYVDQDNNNAQIATSGNLTGKPGSAIDY